MNTIGGTLRTNTVGDDDYKKSIEERRERNVLLDLSIQCVELMGYEMIGEDGMPARGVSTRYYWIEQIEGARVIINLCDLIILYGRGSLHVEQWDTSEFHACRGLINDYLWEYHLAYVSLESAAGRYSDTAVIIETETKDRLAHSSQGHIIVTLMNVFVDYMKRKIYAKKEETT